MTILSIAQGFAPKVGIAAPSQVFGATGQREVEMQGNVNANIAQLLVRHEWQRLKTIATLTGDGTSTAFDLPADYDRMLMQAEVRSATYTSPFQHIVDSDAWLDKVIRQFSFVTPSWTIYGGQMHIMPALPADETAKFFYVSNGIVDRYTGADAATAQQDLDALVIDEEMLRLQMIWTWKAQHGQPYMEDMEAAEDYIEKKISFESGPKTIRVSEPRMPSGVTVAYPFSITVP